MVSLQYIKNIQFNPHKIKQSSLKNSFKSHVYSFKTKLILINGEKCQKF